MHYLFLEISYDQGRAFYEKSANSYNFGGKNTGDFVNYSLKISVVDETSENNFATVPISEREFNVD